MTSGDFPNSPCFLSTSFLVLSIPILSNTADEIQMQEEREMCLLGRKEAMANGSASHMLVIILEVTTVQPHPRLLPSAFFLLVGHGPDSTTDSQLRNGGGSETSSSTLRVGSC